MPADVSADTAGDIADDAATVAGDSAGMRSLHAATAISAIKIHPGRVLSRPINDGCAGTRSALCVSAQTWYRQTRTFDARSGYALHRTQQRAAAPNELALGERPSFDTLESQNIMLRPAKDLQDLAIVASDGAVDDAIGDVKDLYFDDEAWTIRYLVVDTGSWLSSRKVLVSPIAAGKPDWTAKLLPVALTREQVRNSPDIDTDMPVTRQHETDYLDYYSYPYYWGGMGLWGGGGYPGMLMSGYAGYGSATATRAEADNAQARAEARQRDQNPHLRSCNEVVGYHIEASDGEIGHVQGLLVDEDSWAIRYLVVSTSNWWLGHDVLVAPQWIQRVSWAQRTVAVDLTREALKQAPRYDPAVPLSREMEIAAYKHYGRAAYWLGAEAASDRAEPRRDEP